MAKQVAANSEIEIACSVDDLGQAWSHADEINIYRIVQECLSNVLKHARAGFVSISTSIRNGSVRLVLQDDGQGMNAVRSDNRNPRAGLGLTGMQERLSILGGTLKVRSSPQSGTEIAIMIPLPKPKREDG
jgi:signal transduction histidine kinase